MSDKKREYEEYMMNNMIDENGDVEEIVNEIEEENIKCKEYHDDYLLYVA